MADTAGARFDRLVEIMRALRAPGGCPWDREQTLASLRPFVLEEKTRGNLTAEERQLLDQLLYELRLRFVEASKSGGAQPEKSRIILP